MVVALAEVEAGNESSGTLLDRFNRLREQGRPLDFIDLLGQTYNSGQFFRNPDLEQRVREVGHDFAIWETMESLIYSNDDAANRDTMPGILRNALLLGMGKIPGAHGVLSPMIEKYGIQTYKPTVSELVDRSASILAVPEENRERLSIKVRYILEHHRFQDLAVNQINHTALNQTDLTRILADTLSNWEDILSRPKNEIKSKIVKRVDKALSRDFLTGKQLDGKEKVQLARFLLLLFQNPDLRMAYPEVARYLESADKPKPNWEVNGQISALLYSIKLLSDEKELYPNPIFGDELSFIKPPKKGEPGRDSLVKQGIRWGMGLTAAVIAGASALTAAAPYAPKFSGESLKNVLLTSKGIDRERLLASPSPTRFIIPKSPDTLTQEPTEVSSSPSYKELAEAGEREVGDSNFAEYFFGDLQEALQQVTLERYISDPASTERIREEYLHSNSIYILVQGIDQTRKRPNSVNDEGVGRSDVIMLMGFDLRTWKLTALALPRDLVAPELNRYKYKEGGNKINNMTMSTDDGVDVDTFEISRRIVETATGVPVHMIVRMNIDFLEGFDDEEFHPGLFDSLVPDGLGINVDTYIRDDNFPDENYGKKVVEFIPGYHIMGGRELTEYSRTRNSQNDFERIERQKKVASVFLKALGINLFEDFEQGKTDTLDQVISTLEKHYAAANLFSDVNLLEVLKNTKENVKELRTPRGLATLAVLVRNSFNNLLSALVDRESIITSEGLNRGNGLDNATILEANLSQNALKPRDSNPRLAPSPDGNFMRYWEKVRKIAADLFS